MSQTIDELVVSLRLGLDQWESDYKAASKQVRDAAAKLKADNKSSRVQLQIEMLGADAASGKLSSLTRQTEILTGMVERQRQAVTLTNNAHKDAVSVYGANHKASTDMASRLAAEQLALARLEAQLRATGVARTASYAAITAGAMAALNTAAVSLAGIGALSLRASIAAEEGANMVKVSFGSSANKVHEWSSALSKTWHDIDPGPLERYAATLNLMLNSMGLSRDKAFEFSTSLTQLAYDMKSLYHIPIEDAFQKIRSGIAGQTRPLKELGIILSEEAVQEYAYTEGLARRGEALTEQEKILGRIGLLFKQTADAQGDLSRTIDSTANQIFVLEQQASKLEKEIGTALIPTFRELLGVGDRSITLFKSLTAQPGEAAAEIIKLAVEIYGLNKALTLLSKIPLLASLTNPWIAGTVAVGLAVSAVGDYKNKVDELAKANNTKSLIGVGPSAEIANVRWSDSKNRWEKETLSGFYDEYGREIKAWVEVAGQELDNLNQQAEKHASGSTNLTTAEVEREAVKQKSLEAAQAKAAEKRIAQESALQEEIYKLSHSELEVELYDIDLKMAKYRKEYPEIADLAEWGEAKKQEAYRKTGEARDKLQNQILVLNKHELEARLNEIEQERAAYIKKTSDEVQANQWAEAAKTKAVKDAISSRYGTEISAVAEAIKNQTSLEEAYNKAHTAAEAEKKANEEAARFVREQQGIQLPGDTITKTVIDGNTAYQVTELVTALKAAAPQAQSQGTIEYHDTNNNYFTITVPPSAASTEEAANSLAAQIASKLKIAIRGENNAY